MLLRNRISEIDSAPVAPARGYEHLPAASIAVLRWLNANGVDYVLVGPMGRAVRGDSSNTGPAAVVPAPYGRNLDRLASALNSAQARRRPVEAILGIESQINANPHVKLAADELIGAGCLMLRCGTHDLDIEGRPDGVPSYQELLFEAVSFELAAGVSAEVASPEDIELYDHIRRTGVAPELVVTRTGPPATA
jgi:hypothetical protein